MATHFDNLNESLFIGLWIKTRFSPTSGHRGRCRGSSGFLSSLLGFGFMEGVVLKGTATSRSSGASLSEGIIASVYFELGSMFTHYPLSSATTPTNLVSGAPQSSRRSKISKHSQPPSPQKDCIHTDYCHLEINTQCVWESCYHRSHFGSSLKFPTENVVDAHVPKMSGNGRVFQGRQMSASDSAKVETQVQSRPAVVCVDCLCSPLLAQMVRQLGVWDCSGACMGEVYWTSCARSQTPSHEKNITAQITGLMLAGIK